MKFIFIIALCGMMGAQGRNDPSMHDVLIEYNVPTANALRDVVNRWYQKNPFIERHLVKFSNAQLMWYAKVLANDIAEQTCAQAISMSSDLYRSDRHQIYALLKEDRDKKAAMNLKSVFPSALIGRKPVLSTNVVEPNFNVKIDKYRAQIAALRQHIMKSPALSLDEKVKLQHKIMTLFAKARSRVGHVLQQSFGFPHSDVRKSSKIKMMVYGRKAPAHLTKDDMASMCDSVTSVCNNYQTPIQDIERHAPRRAVTRQDVMSTITQLEGVYAGLNAAQKRAYNQLLYMTALELLLYVKETLPMVRDTKQKTGIGNAVHTMCGRMHDAHYASLFVDDQDTKKTPVLCIVKDIIPGVELSFYYTVWKSYLDDVMYVVKHDLKRDAFCERVNALCRRICDKIRDAIIVNNQNEHVSGSPPL